jgi:hypothetical protein
MKEDMTDRERIDRLELAVACLASNLTSNFPLRSHHAHREELLTIVGDVRERDQALEADARRRILESELAELGTVAR